MTTTDTTPERLYFGDNLDTLRQRAADESVDLIYLDPPINSNATYNALFRERATASIPASRTGGLSGGGAGLFPDRVSPTSH